MRPGVLGVMMQPKFLFLGGAVIDIVGELPKAKGNEIRLELGTKQIAQGIRVYPGGSALNSATAAARMGGKTALLSAVGKDAFGALLANHARDCGINVTQLHKLQQPTGASIVLLQNGEKTILSSHGAGDALAPEHFKTGTEKGFDILFCTAMHSQDNMALFSKAAAAFSRANKKVVLAPSITMLRKYAGTVKKLYQDFDLTIMNEEEARFLTREKTIRKALEKLPGKTRVVTAAARGAYAFDRERHYHITAPRVKVADTTGAGDVFSGVFAQQHYSGKTLSESLRTATAAAALQLTRQGANFDYSAREVEAFAKRIPGTKKS